MIIPGALRRARVICPVDGPHIKHAFPLPGRAFHTDAHVNMSWLFRSQYSQDTAKVLAFTSLSMLPALAFFAVFQRRIVGGLTGALKG